MKKIDGKAVLRQLSAIAFSDYSRFMRVADDEDGNSVISVTATERLKYTDRMAINSVKAGTRGIEIKLYDKLKALELIGKYLGLFSGEEGEDDRLADLKSIFGEVGDVGEDTDEPD